MVTLTPSHDIDWDRGGGHFVVSVSSDQTTRLYGPWVRLGKEVSVGRSLCGQCELGPD